VTQRAPQASPVTVSRAASPASQTRGRQEAQASQQAAAAQIAALQRAASASRPAPSSAPAPAPASSAGPAPSSVPAAAATPAGGSRPGTQGVDLDELTSQVARRLRTEFRIDRERFGRLRDSIR
jgi:hypothetical protein